MSEKFNSTMSRVYMVLCFVYTSSLHLQGGAGKTGRGIKKNFWIILTIIGGCWQILKHGDWGVGVSCICLDYVMLFLKNLGHVFLLRKPSMFVDLVY